MNLIEVIALSSPSREKWEPGKRSELGTLPERTWGEGRPRGLPSIQEHCPRSLPTQPQGMSCSSLCEGGNFLWPRGPSTIKSWALRDRVQWARIQITRVYLCMCTYSMLTHLHTTTCTNTTAWMELEPEPLSELLHSVRNYPGIPFWTLNCREAFPTIMRRKPRKHTHAHQRNINMPHVSVWTRPDPRIYKTAEPVDQMI